MTQSTIAPELIEQTINFHGHSCPGLAIGIRAAELALSELGRASDEEIVAIVETDMCGVDAIQFLTGCTFGKGNLIHLDYGKNAFTFHRRSDGKGLRIVARPGIISEKAPELIRLRKKMAREGLTPEEEARLKEAMEEGTERILEARMEELFEIKPASGDIPGKARIMESVPCEHCGEATMESRTRRLLGQTLCIPCFEALERKG
ncbi:MAG: FmdE family protein [Pseudomonadota bacterium]